MRNHLKCHAPYLLARQAGGNLARDPADQADLVGNASLAIDAGGDPAKVSADQADMVENVRQLNKQRAKQRSARKKANQAARRHQTADQLTVSQDDEFALMSRGQILALALQNIITEAGLHNFAEMLMHLSGVSTISCEHVHLRRFHTDRAQDDTPWPDREERGDTWGEPLSHEQQADWDWGPSEQRSAPGLSAWDSPQERRGWSS